MTKQLQKFKQSGFDLFFTNMSKTKAKYFVKFLNSLDKTMEGHPLKFKLNKDQSPHPIYGEEQKITITTRYPAVEYTVAQTTYGLFQNRKLMETALKEFGFTEITYEGSEFYIDVEGDVDQFSKTYKAETEKLVEEVA